MCLIALLNTDLISKGLHTIYYLLFICYLDYIIKKIMMYCWGYFFVHQQIQVYSVYIAILYCHDVEVVLRVFLPNTTMLFLWR